MKFQNIEIRGYLILLLISMYVLYSLFISEYFMQLPSYLKEAIFIPLFFVIFFDTLSNGIKFRMTYPILFYAIIIILYSIIGIINGAPDVGAIRYYLFPLTSYIIVKYYLPYSFLDKLIYFYFVFYLLLLITGYYQIFVYKDKFLTLFAQGILGEEFKTNRLYLFYSVPTLAGTIVGSLMMLFFLLGEYKKWILLGIPVLIFVFSRSSIVALIVAIGFYYIIKFRKNNYLLILLIAISLLLIYFTLNLILTDDAFINRIDMAKDIISYGINPLGKGIGFVSVSGFIKEVIVFDNDFLRFIYEVGIIGSISFLLFVFSVLKKNAIKEMATLILFFFLLMYTGEIHSMYPIPVIIYTSFAIIARKNLLSKKNISDEDNIYS